MKLVLLGKENILKFVTHRDSARLASLLSLGVVTNLICYGGDEMTTNQIAYAKLGEDVRHNTQSEQIERGKAEAALSQARAAHRQATVAELRQQEDARHNLEGERVNWFSAISGYEEAKRSHQENERVNWFNAETQRDYQHRLAKTSERQASVSERQATVAERQLQLNAADTASRRIQAEASSAQAAASWEQAQASLWNAQTQRSSLAESIRHNQVSEAVQATTARGNLIRGQASAKQASVAERGLSISQQQADAATSQAQAAQRNSKVNVANAVTGGFRNVTSGISNLAKSFTDVWEVVYGSKSKKAKG